MIVNHLFTIQDLTPIYLIVTKATEFYTEDIKASLFFIALNRTACNLPGHTIIAPWIKSGSISKQT